MSKMLHGKDLTGAPLFAFVDPASRYTEPQVCRFKFSATLAPYPDESSAHAALNDAGATEISEVGK